VPHAGKLLMIHVVRRAPYIEPGADETSFLAERALTEAVADPCAYGGSATRVEEIQPILTPKCPVQMMLGS
jgi:hypothetical protein